MIGFKRLAGADAKGESTIQVDFDEIKEDLSEKYLYKPNESAITCLSTYPGNLWDGKDDLVAISLRGEGGIYFCRAGN